MAEDFCIYTDLTGLVYGTAGKSLSLMTVGRAVPRVIADGERRLSVRTTFHATLNVDHRSVDGAEAARLLVAFAEAAEGIGGGF